VPEEAVADGQRKREIEVVFRRGGLKPIHPAAKIVAECLLDFLRCKTGSDILRGIHRSLRDLADLGFTRNLFALHAGAVGIGC
jgi:hypothetical protein